MPYPGHFEIPLEVSKRHPGQVLPGMSKLLLEASAAHVPAVDDVKYKTPHSVFARSGSGDGSDTYIEKDLELFFDI